MYSRTYAGKYYGKGYKGYPYRKGYGYGKSTFAGRTRGASTAARKGTSRVTIRIPIEHTRSITFPASSRESIVAPIWTTDHGTMYSSTTLGNNVTYLMYANLYDECKVDSVQYKMYFGGDFTSTGFFTVYTCIDRSTDMTNSGEADANPTAAEVAASSSVVKSTFTSQQRLAFSRKYYARTFLEKNTFWDATVLHRSTNVYEIAGLVNTPTAFNPTLYYYLENSTSSAAQVTLPARIEIEYILTFRNPKASIPNENAKALLLKQPSLKPEPTEKTLDEDETMDVEDDPGTS